MLWVLERAEGHLQIAVNTPASAMQVGPLPLSEASTIIPLHDDEFIPFIKRPIGAGAAHFFVPVVTEVRQSTPTPNAGHSSYRIRSLPEPACTKSADHC